MSFLADGSLPLQQGIVTTLYWVASSLIINYDLIPGPSHLEKQDQLYNFHWNPLQYLLWTLPHLWEPSVFTLNQYMWDCSENEDR